MIIKSNPFSYLVIKKFEFNVNIESKFFSKLLLALVTRLFYPKNLDKNLYRANSIHQVEF